MKLKSILVFGILFLILLQNVSALGITPGRTTVDFSSGLGRTVNFAVLNSEHKNMNVAFAVDGELAQYVSLSNDVVPFSSNEDEKSFSYSFSLPAFLAPGLHRANIVAVELPENIEEQTTIVKSTVSVVTQLYVYVPYPGKYLEGSLDAVADREQGKVFFYIPVVSRGEENINSVSGTVEIYSGSEKITELQTNEISILAGERKELSAVWEPDASVGNYFASARINYDGEILLVENNFTVGEDFVNILGVSANDFKLGDVARIKVLVQNKQTEGIDQATAEFEIYTQELEKIAQPKSEDYEIPALANKELIVYWDTEQVEKGQYTSGLNVDYDAKSISKDLLIDVDETSMTFTGVHGFVISSGAGGLSIKNILFIAIGVLALANLLWLLWWLRHRKK